MKSIDPTRTQEYLLTQEHILDASAWIEGEKLTAQVTVLSKDWISEQAIINSCRRDLGEDHCPAALLIFEANNRLFFV